MNSKIKVVLFGAGSRAKVFLEQCKQIEVVAVFDNDVSKWGKQFGNLCILQPCGLDKIQCKYIVVTTAYEEISRQIEKQHPLLAEKIRSIEIMLDIQYVHMKYIHRYTYEADRSYSTSGKKMVVYTGIFGNYDELKEPLLTEKDVDYVCFTDNKKLRSKKWEIRYVGCEYENAAIEVRKYKCLPHRFFKEYDISFWVDACGRIMEPLKPLIEEFMGKSGILLFPHYRRDCIYEEGAANILQHRDKTVKIINQLYQYSTEMFPEHYGLFCGGYIVREHNREEISKCMEEWYKEIVRNSVRDQISMPYVLKKNHIMPDLIDEHLYSNKWFRVYAHR